MKQISATTPAILAKWQDGVPTETIAVQFGKSARSIQLLASYHKARRPAWYISDIRAKASALQLEGDK
jgi:hypothetical protein